MNPGQLHLEDAKEMVAILQTAKCVARFGGITHNVLSELLVAIVTGGDRIGRNNLGSDVRSPTYGLIEVKSRVLGTDGPNPRVSLKRSNIEKADWFAALRWTGQFALADAVMLPRESARILFNERLQSSGQAHIAWASWARCEQAKSIRQSCLDIMHA